MGFIGQAARRWRGFRSRRSWAIRAGEVLMENVSYDRWLSVEEITVYLGVKRDTVYKWGLQVGRLEATASPQGRQPVEISQRGNR